MKNKLFPVLVLAVAMLPGLAFAGNQVGTTAISLVSASGASATGGLAGSVINAYYQGELDGDANFRVGVSSASGVTGIEGYYKVYLESADEGLYWEAGGAVFSGGGANGFGIIGGGGYEIPIADSFVVGLGGLATFLTQTSTIMIAGVVNIAYKL